jgi:hypothetical protein
MKQDHRGSMEKYNFDEAQQLGYEGLGAVSDPSLLTATGYISPMLVRYVVRTGQLEQRYPGVPVGLLLNALNLAGAKSEYSGDKMRMQKLGPKIQAAERDAEVDVYLDELDKLWRSPNNQRFQ